MSNNPSIEEIGKVEVSPEKGLSTEEVELRTREGFVNKTKHAVGKSYLEIIRTNVFSFFNILLFVIAGLLIYAEKYESLFFLFVLIPNIIIGLYEDIKARVLLSKLRLLTQPRSYAIRNGQEVEVQAKDIVVDDIMVLKSEFQICADGVVVSGSVLVNESLLTGESQSIEKKVGDTVLSGSYVVSGNALVKATKVGKDSYVQSLQNAANKFRRSPSQILRSLKLIFRVIGVVVIVMAFAILLLYAKQSKLSNEIAFKSCIGPLAGSMVGMIPSGLYLLTSVALATAVISLAKKKAQVQDFYSVEMLARTNVLCVDKTGTITDGTMSVKKVVPLGTSLQTTDIEQIVSNILHATKDDNFTARGLKEYFKFELTLNVDTALPFNSENKYSGATFKGGSTYVMGAIEYLDIENKAGIIKRSEEFTFYGYRVLVVGQCSRPIENGHVTGKVTPLALIVMQDHIRPDAIKTFEWFKENGVEIKVISGDNAQTVSEIARQAGIENADHFISLEGMSPEEVAKAAPYYTVFGRVTPEQKEILIESMKDDGHTVAMTGDGVNDILALRVADCSIAMASGSDAAKNVSHLVSLDSNFSTLPDVVKEGRRVINNLQRAISIFLIKTAFAMVITSIFLIWSISNEQIDFTYPFNTNNLYIWEILNIGIGSLFLSLQPNDEPIKSKFLLNILSRVIPAAIVQIFLVAFFFGFSVLNNYYIPQDLARTFSVLAISLFSFVILVRVCWPFDIYRIFLVVGLGFIGGTAILADYFALGDDSILGIKYSMLSWDKSWLLVATFIVSVGLYIGLEFLANFLHKKIDKRREESKYDHF